MRYSLFCMQHGWQQRCGDVERLILLEILSITVHLSRSEPYRSSECASMIIRHICITGYVASRRCDEIHADEDDLRTGRRTRKKLEEVATL